MFSDAGDREIAPTMPAQAYATTVGCRDACRRSTIRYAVCRAGRRRAAVGRGRDPPPAVMAADQRDAGVAIRSGVACSVRSMLRTSSSHGSRDSQRVGLLILRTSMGDDTGRVHPGVGAGLVGALVAIRWRQWLTAITGRGTEPAFAGDTGTLAAVPLSLAGQQDRARIWRGARPQEDRGCRVFGQRGAEVQPATLAHFRFTVPTVLPPEVRWAF